MNKDEMKKVYDEIKKVYDDRTCLRCGDYVAIDDNGIDIDGDERAYMYTYLVCDSCGATYKIEEYFEITERTVEEEE